MKKSPEVKLFIPMEKELVLRTSFFKMYLRCPSQALFRYFKGIVSLPRSYTTFGTCLHKSAESQNLYKRDKGRDIKLSVVQDVFNEEFKLRRKHTEWTKGEDPNKMLLEGVKGCVPIYHERAKRFNPLYIEEQIKLKIPEANLTVTGTLDLVTQGHLIRDLKTRRKSPQWLDPIKSLQKRVYSFGYYERFKRYPKGFVLDTLVRKATPEFTTSDIQVVEAQEFEALKQLLIKITMSVRMGMFFPKEEGNFLCSPHMCGYWDRCHKGDWMKLPKDGKIYMENTPLPKQVDEEDVED